ncbi:MAG: lysophospholipid acyltransferase family protein [Candidatus Binatia bacterium]|nr:lysophospholipid acyltransferase family protein [Candidatus Binatia bacterium]
MDSGRRDSLRRAWEDRWRDRWKNSYRPARDRAIAGLVGLGRRLAGFIGLRRMRRVVDAIMPLVVWRLDEPRKLALEHMAQALPELSAEERERNVAAMFRGLGRSVVEILLLDEIAQDLDLHVRSEGLGVMDAALAEGNGVVAITGHIGNWELLAAFFGLKGYPVAVIATPVKGDRMNEANIELRRSVNVETVQRDGPGAARAILRTLKQGRILAILMDQNTHGQSAEVPFFGRPAPTPIGPAALSLRTGAVVVGVFIHREEDGSHVIRVTRPDLPDRASAAEMGKEVWLTDVTARLTALIESEVRRRPDEWVWWHRRWA